MNKVKCRLASLAGVLALTTPLLADVKLNNVFGDNMVLQRDMKVPVWGTAEVGEAVTVEFNGQRVATKAAGDGKWRLELAPMKACTEPKTLSVTGRNSRTVTNILIGDVWFCSGQSNMAFSLDKDALAATEIPNSSNPLIRMLQAAWQTSDTPLESVQYGDKKAGDVWCVLTPETAKNCSAVAYWFAKDVQKSTGVPIGLIRSAKSGSPIEAWLPKEFVMANEGGKLHWDNYQKAVTEFPAKLAEFTKAAKAAPTAENQGAAVQAKTKKKDLVPTDPSKDGNHPTGLFYGSVIPFTPMAIKGVLWYQGESNGCSPYAHHYGSLFSGLINTWRQAWGREDLPFLFVELPPFRPMSPVPEFSAWSWIRDGQFQALALPNTGMASVLDYGNEKDIHPTDKRPVGERLAQWAKAKFYGMELVPSGPLFEKLEVNGDKLIITFKHAGKGLEAVDLTLIGGHKLSKDKLQGFSISGADEKFVWADAQITGPNQVTVSASGVKLPVAVRYAWSSFPLCNLFNKDGLPAAAFRSDRFVPTPNAKAAKIVAPANMNTFQ